MLKIIVYFSTIFCPSSRYQKCHGNLCGSSSLFCHSYHILTKPAQNSLAPDRARYMQSTKSYNFYRDFLYFLPERYRTLINTYRCTQFTKSYKAMETFVGRHGCSIIFNQSLLKFIFLRIFIYF